MGFSVRFVCTLVLACTPALAQVTPVSITGLSTTLAEVDGHSLTNSDLEQQKSGSLLQARYQYYMSQRKALDELVDEELMSLAAAEKHISVDQLEKEIYKGITDPTDDQLKVYFEGMESDEPYTAVKDRVLDHIRQLRRTRARTAYVKSLHEQAHLRIMLQPPNATVNIVDAHYMGAKQAPVTLVEFADFECPYCQKVNPLLLKLKQEYGDKLTVVYKDFPLPMHHHSQKAAEATRCAGEQGKYLEFHDALYDSRQLDTPELKKHAAALKLDQAQFDKCLDDGKEADAVKKDLEEGMKLGLTGTPSFFVNNHFFHGAVEYATLREMVEQQLYVPPSSPSLAQTASTK